MSYNSMQFMSKKFFRKIIQYLLWFQAKLILWRYQPLVIGVTGSCGKSSTKEAIYYALKNYFSVAKSHENLNTEIGLPLTIIQGKDAKKNVFLWFYNIIHTFYLLLIKNKNYPKILILEMSEDHPGIMRYLYQLAKPKIGVISWINEIPVHASYFSNAHEVHQEIQTLVTSLSDDGTAILNSDNAIIMSIKNKIKGKIMTYGFRNADVLISDYNLIASKNDLLSLGMTLRIEYQGSYVPLKLKSIFGKPQAYALGAAFAVGLSLGLNLVAIANSLSEYKVLKARTHLIKGINNSLILDDSYNSNPDALKEAIETYRDIITLMKKDSLFNLKRRILVIGNMNELGKYTEEAHRRIAQQLINNADLIVLIGDYTQYTLNEYQKITTNTENIIWFQTSKEAGKKLAEMIKAGDFILIKGSRGVHMEMITMSLMQEPQKAEEYLEFSCPT